MNEYLKTKREEFEEIVRQSRLYIEQSDSPEYVKDILFRNIDHLALEASVNLRRHLRAEEQLTKIRKITNV